MCINSIHANSGHCKLQFCPELEKKKTQRYWVVLYKYDGNRRKKKQPSHNEKNNITNEME